MKRSAALPLMVMLTVPSGAALAQSTTSGTFNVTTTIQASCESPSPNPSSLSLTLETDDGNGNPAALDANDQPLGSPVTVTIPCSGNPDVTQVAFDDGRHSASSPGTDERYMRRSGAAIDSEGEDDWLGYKLYARAGTGHSASDIANGTAIGTNIDTNNILDMSSDTTNTFMITGRITDSRTTFSDATEVTGGNYTDTVSMTVTYN